MTGNGAVLIIHIQCLVAWRSGNVFHPIKRSYPMPGRVITVMGDCLRAGKPSQYVTSRLGQLSLPSLWGR